MCRHLVPAGLLPGEQGELQAGEAPGAVQVPAVTEHPGGEEGRRRWGASTVEVRRRRREGGKE